MNAPTKEQTLIPPLIEDFHEFSYILNHLQQAGLGGGKNWDSEINQIAELRRKAIEFIQWENNPDFSGVRVRVAVIGDFNAGKSSFINSLLGETLCPVEARPTTSSITTFKYGDKEEIFLLNAEDVDGGCTHFKQLVGRKEYEKKVCHQGGKGLRYEFEVYYPFSGFRDIELYDTPGFGNAQNADDERITLDKCDIADALFFVFDINRGNLGEDMRQRLIQIKKTNPNIRICAILNKSDCKSSPTVIEELCEMWRDEGLFGDVIPYSAKTELQQFKDTVTSAQNFSIYLSNTAIPLIVRHENGEVYYKPVNVSSSVSRLSVMNQLDSIQSQKKKILEENLRKSLRTYVTKSRLLVSAVSRKIENEFERESTTLPDELKGRLISALNVEAIYVHVSKIMLDAVKYALRRRPQTKQEKSFWYTPWWRAEFDKTRFFYWIKNCQNTAQIKESIEQFIAEIPPENFRFVKELCSELQCLMENFSNLFEPIAQEIKSDLPGVKDDFGNRDEIRSLLSNYQEYAKGEGVSLFSSTVGSLVDNIIAQLERCRMYDLGTMEAKSQFTGEFLQKLAGFAERLEFRGVRQLEDKGI